MSGLSKPSVLLIGFDQLDSDFLKQRVLSLPYNFVNGLEIKLNENFKNSIIGVLVLNNTDDLQLIYDLPNLRIVSCNSSGTDYLDVEKLYSKNVMVKNCPVETADSTSNIAMILILNMSRKILPAIQALHNPTIYHNSVNEYFGMEIRGKILGIVGFGHIGQQVAYKASLAFGMQIVYHQRNKKSTCLFTYYDVLNDMLPIVDFLVLSCPLTSSTRHLINIDRLKLMKPTAYVINVSRGLVIKTNDLVEALRCGIIAGAGLDVTDPFPLSSSHPLLHMNNVMVLPHIGTFTEEARDGMLDKAIQNLQTSLENY